MEIEQPLEAVWFEGQDMPFTKSVVLGEDLSFC